MRFALRFCVLCCVLFSFDFCVLAFLCCCVSRVRAFFVGAFCFLAFFVRVRFVLFHFVSFLFGILSCPTCCDQLIPGLG